MKTTIALIVIALIVAVPELSTAAVPVYPPSEVITGMHFDMSTLKNRAPGNDANAGDSDNWPVTWADDDHQYTSFGDGVGFKTFNTVRASLGIARIEGNKDDYSAYDLFKTGSDSGGWAGKSLGILCVGGVLYLFRNGTGSTSGAFEQTQLWYSQDHGLSWEATQVRWIADEMPGGLSFFSPTFLQFGRDYAGARDNYVYIYAPEHQGGGWNVQFPGAISLLRVDKTQLLVPTAYEYLSDFSADGTPQWTGDPAQRAPAFFDPDNGVMRTSVSYNPGLGRYILITQQVNRFADQDFHIGVYEAPQPWGPWHTVLLDNPTRVGPELNRGTKTVFWNLSNKWLSNDGRQFVMVYTGPGADHFGTVEGWFSVRDDDVAPTTPTQLVVY